LKRIDESSSKYLVVHIISGFTRFGAVTHDVTPKHKPNP